MINFTTRPPGALRLKYPIVLPLLGFICGILLSGYTAGKWLYIGVLLAASLIAAIRKPGLAFLVFIPIGILLSSNPLLNPENNIANYLERKSDLEGTIFRQPEHFDERTRLFLDAETVTVNGTDKGVWGKVIISIDGTVPGLHYGDRIRIAGVRLHAISGSKNPGAPDVGKYYLRQGVYAMGFLRGGERLISFGRDGSYNPFLSYVNSVRLKYADYVAANFKAPESSMVNAVTIGDKSGLPRQLRTDFSRAGVAHVLAISGLHVGAVAVFFFFLIKWLLKRSEYIMLRFTVIKLAAVLTLLPVFLYTALAGFSSSATRAFIMIAVFLLSVASGRSEYKLNTLGVAAFIILLVDPGALFLLSFQLSFTAVLAILLADKAYPFKFDTLKNTLLSIVKTSLAAALATYPFVSEAFGVLPLVSVPANILIVPFVDFILVPVSLVSFAVFRISAAAATPLIGMNVFLSGVLINGVETLLEIPYSWLAVPRPGAAVWVLTALAMGSLAIKSAYPRLRLAFPLLLAILAAVTAYSVTGGEAADSISVTVLDVGENKSTVFFSLPEHKNILIDGGYSREARSGYSEKTAVGGFLTSRGVHTIDYLILTSADRDHLAGAAFIMTQFDVKNLLTNGDKLDSGVWEIIRKDAVHWENLQKIRKPVTIGNYVLEIIPAPSGTEIRDSILPLPAAVKLHAGSADYIIAETGSLAIHGPGNNIYGCNACILYLPQPGAGVLSRLAHEHPGILLLVTNKSIESGPGGPYPGFPVLDIETTGALSIIQNRDGITYKTFGGEKGTLSE